MGAPASPSVSARYLPAPRSGCAGYALARASAYTFEDSSTLCLSDGELSAVDENSLRYGCGDEVVDHACVGVVDGGELVVTVTLTVTEGPGSCGSYDNTFFPRMTCEIPATGAGLDLVYRDATEPWAELPDCSFLR